MLGLSQRPDGWTPPVVRTVAREGQGIREALAAVLSFHRSGRSSKRAAELWQRRLKEMLRDRIAERLPQAELEAAAESVAARRRDPYSIVDEWLKRI
jgi:LAO/AO transport system kinase